MHISGLVLAKNEENNIGRCLASLSWLPEVILVDNLSSDSTVQVAQKFSNVKVVSSEWLGFAETKKFGLQFVSNQWVLWLDADEEIPQKLQTEIKNLFSNSEPQFAAFDFPRKTYFLNKWIKHCDWYPDHVVRLFNLKKANINSKKLHEGIELNPGERLGHIKQDLLHYSYTSLAQYFSKMIFYGREGALEIRRKKRKFRLSDLIFRPFYAFMKSYFLKLGFLDGYFGYIISMGSAVSSFIKYANLYVIEKNIEEK